jgi:hypothetical protein
MSLLSTQQPTPPPIPSLPMTLWWARKSWELEFFMSHITLLGQHHMSGENTFQAKPGGVGGV